MEDVFDTCEDDGDEIILVCSRGWGLDRDGWWSRPIRRGDLAMALRGEREHDRFVISHEHAWATMTNRGVHIGSGEHAFTSFGRLYCRNAKQKRRLDNGLPV